MNVRNLLAWLLTSCLFIFSLPSQATESLIIGVAPHSSARVILESHATLRSFLEARFNRPVQIVTAPTFTEFTKRSLQGQYDLLITSPHLALLAKDKANYHPMLTYTQGLETVLIAATGDCPQKRPLRVLGLDPISFVTLTGLQELASRGLTKESGQIEISYASASDSTSLAVIQGRTDVAIISKPNYNKLNEDVKSKVAICWNSPAKPSRIYLAKAGKSLSIEDWQQAISDFTQSTEGTEHLVNNKFTAFRAFHANELTEVQPLADAAWQLLQAE